MAIIGITCLHDYKNAIMRQNETYIQAVKKAGGVPVLLPCVSEIEQIRAMVDSIDGLLVAGGPDVSPLCFGEEPCPGLGTVTPLMDEFELPLIREAIAARKPVLGICRGMQSLNVALGGTLYQDISSQLKDVLQHRQNAPRDYTAHTVALTAGSQIARIFGTTELRVNTFHHQAVKQVATDLIATAHAPDGIIEAIEIRDSHQFVIGVQWHPECMWNSKYNYDQLFASFVNSAR